MIDSLAVLTLARPDKANALTLPMLTALTGYLDEIAAGDTPALILTGAGKVFSAGADLDALADGLANSPEWERLSARLASMPCLTVAALNGTVAGGAFGMMLACDLRVATPGGMFFYPVLKRGVLPQPSDCRRLTQMIGASRCRMLLLGGQQIDAAEALDWGLIDRIAADPFEKARDLAKDCLAAGQERVMNLKGMIGQ